MSKNSDLSWVKSAIAAQTTLEPPLVDRVQPQVRSGANIQALSGRRGQNHVGSLGNVVIEWGYDVSAENVSVLKNLLADLGASLAAPQSNSVLPKGLHYCGTFGVIFSSEKGAGRYRTIWSFDKVKQISKLGDISRKDHPDLERFVRELRDLWEPNGGWSESMYQVV